MNTANTLQTVNTEAQALALTDNQSLTWTNKAGKTLAAHSATAQAFAPRSARVSAAHAATVQQLKNGQFRPFLRDLIGALSATMQAGLSDAVFKGMARDVDGIQMVPAEATLKPEAANKLVMQAAAMWAVNPYTVKKAKGGVIECAPVAKINAKQQALLNVLLDFAGMLGETSEAGTIEATATEATSTEATSTEATSTEATSTEAGEALM